MEASTGQPTPTTWFPVGRARRRAVAFHLPRPRLRARGLHRGRRLDRGPRGGGGRRPVLLRRQRARARRGAARGARRVRQRHRHRGRDGRRLLRGGDLDPGDAIAAPIPAGRLEYGVSGPRHSRRGGVPPDHVLARGGRAADHRRQHRPRDAALAPDRARDDRPAGARRLRQPRRRQVARVHRRGPPACAGDRPPPPADRALPHRRAGDPLGRGPRGGRAARARDVAGARGADAGRDRRREDLPPRPPDRRGRRARRASCSPTSSPAPRSPFCGSRTRPRSCCTI